MQPRDAASAPAEPDPYTDARERMVRRTIVDRGIVDERVIAAMRLVPRHVFVPPDQRDQAYDDRAMQIGFGKTISQPYIVALMTEAAQIKPGDRVLEIGTGSGYQAAILAVMGAQVYSIELNEGLAKRTQQVLQVAGFPQIKTKIGDGFFGWPDASPFDAILVTCAAPRVPEPLLAQLKIGGHIVIPIGELEQHLEAYTKTQNGTTHEKLLDVVFSTMSGAIEVQ